MRKQALIHLHGLLSEIRRFVFEDAYTPVPADAFEAYNRLDVAPTSVAQSKAAHQDAVFALLRGLTETLRVHPVADPCL